MLSQKVYMEAADMFGVSVGVAHSISKGIRELETSEEIVKYNDDRYINGVISRCIERGKYQTLQRTLYRIRREMGKRKVKEVTIYRKAWYYIVNGHDKTNKSKRGEILNEIG
jgi:type II secretory pathway component PulJ